jgi:hypothetical protein
VENDCVEDGTPEGPSRRDFIRRGALALGLTAWAAPLVQMARAHGHRTPQPGPAPEQIGVQAITASCTTCVVECGSVTECGTNGAFVCFCAPVPGYPLANCICASEVFCDEAIPCTAGCPPGWACVQGCCDVPVCLPPCPDGPAPLAAREGTTGTRLTVTGRRL